MIRSNRGRSIFGLRLSWPRVSAQSGLASAKSARIRKLPVVQRKRRRQKRRREARGHTRGDSLGARHRVNPAATAIEGDEHWQNELQKIVLPQSSVTRRHFRHQQTRQAVQAKAVGENQEMHVSAVQLRPRRISRDLVRAKVYNHAVIKALSSRTDHRRVLLLSVHHVVKRIKLPTQSSRGF